MLTFIKAGLMTQWTDLGRKHSQVNGYSQSGAVDWFNFQLANARCGNPLNKPAIEVAAGNITFVVSEPCLLSISGAPCEVAINGVNIDDNHYRQWLQKNDQVSLGPALKGVFSYLAFSASFNVPLFANSVCAVKRERIGGANANGSAIKSGDSFAFVSNIKDKAKPPLGNEHGLSPLAPILQEVIDAQLAAHKIIPFFFGYQDNCFSSVQKQRFLANEFVASASIDKMGVRLEGSPIECELSDMTSQPMANGAIQIPGNGVPIIMRNDRQTIGGYPVIGTLSSAGLAILSQVTAKQSITFVPSDIRNASIWHGFIDLALKEVLNNAQDIPK